MPVITSVLLVAFRIEMLSSAVWFCVVMISLGAAMASYSELKFNAYGVMLMLASSTCEGLRIVLTQKLLNNMQVRAAARARGEWGDVHHRVDAAARVPPGALVHLHSFNPPSPRCVLSFRRLRTSTTARPLQPSGWRAPPSCSRCRAW